MDGTDLARVVTTKQKYSWATGSTFPAQSQIVRARDSRVADAGQDKGRPLKHVVAYDYGIKQNILRMLVDRGCRVTVVPAMTSPDTVLPIAPHAVFLPNAPATPHP